MQHLDQGVEAVCTSKDGRTGKCFPALEWLATVSSHIPNRGEQMVRYYAEVAIMRSSGGGALLPLFLG
jgi:hypothetical protein